MGDGIPRHIDPAIQDLSLQLFTHIRALVSDNYVLPSSGALDIALHSALDQGNISADISDKLHFVDGRTKFFCAELEDMLLAAEQAHILKSEPGRKGYTFLISPWAAQDYLRSAQLGDYQDIDLLATRVVACLHAPENNL